MKKKQAIYRKAAVTQFLVAVVLFFLAAVCFWGVYRLSLTYSSTMWTLIDSLFTSFAVAIRSPTLTLVMKSLTDWGYFGPAILWFLLGGLFLRRKDYMSLMMVMVLALGAEGIGIGMKEYIHRSRPIEFALIQESGKSFPSMHALASTVLYVMIVYFIYHYSHSFWKTAGSFIAALILIFAISFSRVYLGVHYFSDILAGLLTGIGYLSVVLGGVKLYWARKMSKLTEE